MFMKAAIHIFMKDWINTLRIVLYFSRLLVLNKDLFIHKDIYIYTFE